MVVLNRIYTRTGDGGTTALGTGERRHKFDLRVTAYGTVDETNATIGMARQHTAATEPLVDAMLERIQNDLFDLGADLCTPETDEPPPYEPLRIVDAQVERIEREIDTLNAALKPLRSFVLPGGTVAAAHLHVARTVVRRAERSTWAALDTYHGGMNAMTATYLNRLSDLLFILSRLANKDAGGDVLWQPGANR